jgi:hypothetical protein
MQMIRVATIPSLAKFVICARLIPCHQTTAMSPAICPTSMAVRPRPSVAHRPQLFTLMIKRVPFRVPRMCCAVGSRLTFSLTIAKRPVLKAALKSLKNLASFCQNEGIATYSCIKN